MVKLNKAVEVLENLQEKIEERIETLEDKKSAIEEKAYERESGENTERELERIEAI